MSTSILQIALERVRAFAKDASHPLIVITGPTGSGKTSLSVELAGHLDAEIVNADSRQVYSDIQVANELIPREERRDIPHHLFSFRSPLEPLSVAEYKTLAEKVIEDVRSRNKLPILVGGSVMWIEALVRNYRFPESAVDPVLRKSVSMLSLTDQLEKLRQLDPESWEKLSLHRNPRYIGRALEIAMITGKPKSYFRVGRKKYHTLKIALTWSRVELYKRINARVYSQLERGLIEEVKFLVETYAKGLSDPWEFLKNYPAFNSIGIKEVLPYLMGGITKEKMITDLQQGSRNYAKRQLTWLRKDPELIWLPSKDV